MAAIVADIKCPSVEGLSISSNQIRALHIAEELAVVPTTITIIAWDETTTPLNDMGREVTVSIAGQTYTGKVVSVNTRKLTHDRNLWEIRYEIANEPYEWGYIGFDFPQQFVVDGVIALYFFPPVRSLLVKKMRGTNHDKRVHPFEINSKPYEVWYYNALNRRFVFVDYTGFGDYELVEPEWWQ